MAYAGSNFTNTMQRPGGGQQALRNLRTGGQQGRNAMSRYTGPNARSPNQPQGGRQGIRNLLRGPNPNQNARDNANPNARFNRGPQYAGPALGGGSDLNSPGQTPPGPPPTLLGSGSQQGQGGTYDKWLAAGSPTDPNWNGPIGLGPIDESTGLPWGQEARTLQPIGGGSGYTLPPGTGPGPMTYTPGGGVSHDLVKAGPAIPPTANLPPQRWTPPGWLNHGRRNDNPNARFNRGGGRDQIRRMMQRQPIGMGGSGQPIYDSGTAPLRQPPINPAPYPMPGIKPAPMPIDRYPMPPVRTNPYMSPTYPNLPPGLSAPT